MLNAYIYLEVGIFMSRTCALNMFETRKFYIKLVEVDSNISRIIYLFVGVSKIPTMCRF